MRIFGTFFSSLSPIQGKSAGSVAIFVGKTFVIKVMQGGSAYLSEVVQHHEMIL